MPCAITIPLPLTQTATAASGRWDWLRSAELTDERVRLVTATGVDVRVAIAEPKGDAEAQAAYVRALRIAEFGHRLGATA